MLPQAGADGRRRAVVDVPIGHAGPVPSAAPELSSLHTTLGDLVGRLATIATEQRSTEGGEVLASELFAIEGTLLSAHRRLGRALLRTR